MNSILSTHDILQSAEVIGADRILVATDTETKEGIKKIASKIGALVMFSPIRFKNVAGKKVFPLFDTRFIINSASPFVPREKKDENVIKLNSRPVFNFSDMTDEQYEISVRECNPKTDEETTEEYEERIHIMTDDVKMNTKTMLQALDAIDKGGKGALKNDFGSIYPPDIGHCIDGTDIGDFIKDRTNSRDTWTADKIAKVSYLSIKREGYLKEQEWIDYENGPRFSIRFNVDKTNGEICTKKWDNNLKAFVSKPCIYDGTVDDYINAKKLLLIDGRNPKNDEIGQLIPAGSAIRVIFKVSEMRKLPKGFDLDVSVDELYVIPNTVRLSSGSSTGLQETPTDKCLRPVNLRPVSTEEVKMQMKAEAGGAPVEDDGTFDEFGNEDEMKESLPQVVKKITRTSRPISKTVEQLK